MASKLESREGRTIYLERISFMWSSVHWLFWRRLYRPQQLPRIVELFVADVGRRAKSIFLVQFNSIQAKNPVVSRDRFFDRKNRVFA
jgi:hypothetical protein